MTEPAALSAPPGIAARVLDIILGTQPAQRLWVARSLMSAAVFLACLGLIAYASFIDMMDPREGAILSACIIVSCTLFYIALRSGWNQRFADPALTLPQIVAGLTWIACAYATTNEAHGGTLMLVSLVLTFGVFNMNARRAQISGLYAVVVMGAVMVYKTIDDPLRYPAKVEWVYFVFVVTIVPTITILAAQLSRMRQRLKNQKADLAAALVRIQELATRDALTGLINRRQMTQILSEHAALSKRQQAQFSIAVLDLDYFKQVNDQYGHGVGDEVLRNFAVEAKRLLRETDVIARWGGEEFLLLMPEGPPGAPVVGIERLRLALSKMPLSVSAPAVRMTFSAGLTPYRSGEPMDEAIDRADKALYRAKAAGRDRVLVV